MVLFGAKYFLNYLRSEFIINVQKVNFKFNALILDISNTFLYL
ncbi:hypothetical protein ING2E5B_1125 [Fermentimonas caenicola]|jgi:hypothetical protein|uniref:Uncharacterized protein n=1 Tax=Fermentimonas caenicola TaxID=1562970 RepID=A0A098C1R1_9BACT|nr:hypothetical protein ING2E5B_1125 [Fermentimonas caenicola]